MSVGEDQTECPLCMEPLELDDLNFFPCTCGYQICRFCWHRIRTDENGLCPACRKAYPEDPAEFKPLTEDELQRIKKERRQKEAQRKQKAAENRKHLANVRVVQKNLVFVVGLSQRLADPEVLKKHEYFGKFGKIHKVVINQSTSYAGSQGPSASAYVTYQRPEDALKAIQAVNNIHVDGRTLKASLGTTKYCSHFLRGSQCPKSDCMYLHELGEESASFTKEEMQQGKHQEYEQKLYEMFMNSQNLAATAPTVPAPTTTTKAQTRKKTSSPIDVLASTGNTPPPQTTKEAWPSLQPPPSSTPPSNHKLTNGNKAPPQNPTLAKPDTQNAQNRAPGFHRTNGQHPESKTKTTGSSSPDFSPGSSSGSSSPNSLSQSQFISTTQQSPMGAKQTPFMALRAGNPPPPPGLMTSAPPGLLSGNSAPPPGLLSGGVPPLSMSQGMAPPPGLVSAAARAAAVARKLPFQSPSESMSLFSSSNGFPSSRTPKPPQPLQPDDNLSVAPEIPETIPVSTSTDWEATFGFSSSQSQTDSHDDDLGFDPWNESTKALAEIIENENSPSNSFGQNNLRLGYSVPMPHSPLSSPRQREPLHGRGQPHPHPGAVPPLMPNLQQLLDNNKPKNLPPGFTPNHIGALSNNQMATGSSKILSLMHFPTVPGNHSNLSNGPSGYDMMNSIHESQQSSEPFRTKDWQDGLRALLPNINISFGEDRLLNRSPQPPHSRQQQLHLQQQQQLLQQQQRLQQQQQQQQQQKNWSTSNSVADASWDPAIVTSGNITDSEEPPHWMASLHHLTEDTTASSLQMPSIPTPPLNSRDSNPSHRLPLLQQFSYRNSSAPPIWPPMGATHSPLGGPTHNPLGGATQPPPGFHRPQVAPEVAQMVDGFP